MENYENRIGYRLRALCVGILSLSSAVYSHFSLAFVDPVAYRCAVPNQIVIHLAKTTVSCDAPPCGFTFSVSTPDQQNIQFGGGTGSFQCQTDGHCPERSLAVDIMPPNTQCKECDPFSVNKTEISFAVINKYGETPLVDDFKKYPITIVTTPPSDFKGTLDCRALSVGNNLSD